MPKLPFEIQTRPPLVSPKPQLSRRRFIGAGIVGALAAPALLRATEARSDYPSRPIAGYQRLFPDLPGAQFSSSDLARLALGDGAALTGMTSEPETLKDKDGKPRRDARGQLIITATPETEQDDEENFGIPAGYTYLGQFIDHDLTFNSNESFEKSAANAPNLRSARFDLDSVYGGGPADQPYLFESDGRRLKVGRALTRAGVASVAHDHPRIDGRAVLGDKRNDENVLVSQMHGVFAAFHNRVAADRPDADFDMLRRIVTRHYQWIVLTDFLPRIVGEAMMEQILPGFSAGEPARPMLKIAQNLGFGEMPLEFSDAAYRFGHSMIRPIYRLNRRMTGSEQERRDNPAIAGRRQIFAASQYGGLNGFREYPAEWGIDWRLFFEVEGKLDASRVKDGPRRIQPSYKIDTSLVNPLAFLPEFSEPARSGDLARDPQGMPKPRAGLISNLALRNLMRGAQRDLPCGEDVARAMGVDPIAACDLRVGKATMEHIDDARPIADYGESFKDRSPLWFYVLAEARHLWAKKAAAAHATKEACDAIPTRLGPVGGRIIAETMVALMAKDPESVLNAGPGWRPSYARGSRFAMPEVLGFAGLTS